MTQTDLNKLRTEIDAIDEQLGRLHDPAPPGGMTAKPSARASPRSMAEPTCGTTAPSESTKARWVYPPRPATGGRGAAARRPAAA